MRLREYNFSIAFFAAASLQPADRFGPAFNPVGYCMENPGACRIGRSDSGEFVGIVDAKRIQLFAFFDTASQQSADRIVGPWTFAWGRDSGEFVGIFEAKRIQLFYRILCCSKPTAG